MPNYVPYEYVTHTIKVKRFYKKVLYDMRSWIKFRHDFRIQAVLMRQKFEDNRHIKDPIEAKRILEEAEKKFVHIRYPIQFRWPSSFGGCAFDREDTGKPPDGMIDYWHPLEKAQYPDYFARREQRKKEFVEWYDKTYGRPPYEKFS